MKYQIQETIETASLGFVDMPVRFFIWDEEINDGEGDIVETNEEGFMAAPGAIEYERHSVFANGCRQICLTKTIFTF
jgi:hypothetical protein